MCRSGLFGCEVYTDEEGALNGTLAFEGLVHTCANGTGNLSMHTVNTGNKKQHIRSNDHLGTQSVSSSND